MKNFIILFLFGASIGVRAQQSSVFNHGLLNTIPNNYFSNQLFEPNCIFSNYNTFNTFEFVNKNRETVFSGLYNHKPFSEVLADSFYKSNPYEFINNRAFLELGNYYFNNEEFDAAYQNYLRTNNALISNQEIAEKNFRMGYSALTLGKDSLAHDMFASVKDILNKFTKPDNYYYGLLEYFNKNYDTAYNRFNLVKDEPAYKSVVPFYLAEIKYLTNNKSKALEIAKKYLSDSSVKMYYVNELHQLIGQIYFEKNAFDEAVPYLEYYNTNSYKLRREDIFELGYAYYQTGKIELAAKELVKVYEKNDYIAELALYLLGDCYLKSQKKEQARIAFKESANKNITKTVNENARFLFSKLSYELGFDEDALNGSYNLLKKYPESKYKEQSYKMLSDLILTSTNYKGALSIIKELDGNEEINKTHQWVSFNNGLALIQQNKFEDAVASFKESLEFAIDPLITSLTRFWLAEAQYENNDLKNAIFNAKEYLKLPVTEGTASVNSANTILAYSYLKLNDKANAKEYIKRIIVDENNSSIDTLQINILSKVLYNINRNENAIIDSLIMGYNMSSSNSDNTIALLKDFDKRNELTTSQKNIFNVSMGNALIYSDKYMAIEHYTKTSLNTKDRFYNEAQYKLALLLYEQNKKEDVITVLDKVILNNSLFDEWNGRAYLLRAKLYEQENDYLNASSLLQSVIDSCESGIVVEKAISELRTINNNATKQFGIINNK